MSFFSNIRFGRSSKKSKNNGNNNNTAQILQQPKTSIYNSSNNGSTLSLRRTHSPSKQSVKSFQTNHTNKSQQQLLFGKAYNGQQQNVQQPQLQQQQQPSQQSQHLQQAHAGGVAVRKQPPLFLCEPFVKTALVKGSFKTIVQLPKYVDFSEWLALNVFETFTHLNQFYGVLAEYVTVEKYPTMKADANTEYLWYGNNNRQVSLPASQYIDLALTWISNKLNDQNIFPTKNGIIFPPNFIKDIKNICRQMFRIFAHIYFNHFEKILHLSLEAHWNSFFAHFISFIKEFDLIERKELEPLLPLIENFEAQGKIIN
ncbi:hypothetical protein PACTADRAFT_43065 [Pachysolen tannophilus NRRL Y-2460]|uniref:Mob1/phocein family protein n=1 Tax=Pachysolen tannophilus NRRL Y-2460 TaxID=669874 RepID=A0A1E4TUA7_PACTA|nr:hypothetical protein PACTADRAFT_43065 [Pachysolen tannophilus NRRL Y-2460]